MALAPALVLYSAFDSVVGLGTGVLVRDVGHLAPGHREGAAALAEQWWAVPTPVGLVSFLAQLSWVVVLGATTVARAGDGRGVRLSLLGATAFFPLLHVQPFGALSMGALLVAVVLVDRRAEHGGKTSDARRQVGETETGRVRR